MRTKICEACKKSFVYRHIKHRTCSRQCGIKVRGGQRALVKWIKMNCLKCNKEVIRNPSKLAGRSYAYCSQECKRKNIDISGQKNPNYRNAGWRICDGCHEKYHSYDKRRQFCGVCCSQKVKKSGALSVVKYGKDGEEIAMNKFSENGYLVLKSKDSRGPFDFIAFHPQELKTRLVQVKRTKCIYRRCQPRDIRALKCFKSFPFNPNVSVELWTLVDGCGWFSKRIV